MSQQKYNLRNQSKSTLVFIPSTGNYQRLQLKADETAVITESEKLVYQDCISVFGIKVLLTPYTGKEESTPKASDKKVAEKKTAKKVAAKKETKSVEKKSTVEKKDTEKKKIKLSSLPEDVQKRVLELKERYGSEKDVTERRQIKKEIEQLTNV
jgi:hypothetical protein